MWGASGKIGDRKGLAFPNMCDDIWQLCVDGERANQLGEWVMHLARTGVKRNAQKVLVQKSE
jgi:hypothetical protein